MLKKLMQEYIEKYSIERLEQETGVKNAILREILNNNPRRAKFRQTTLDALYEFFGLVADNFYFDNLKKWYPKTETLLGTFLRTKRIQMGYSHEKLASLINGNKLAIQRLEM